MNRRGFLKLLAGTAAASTTAYFFAPIGGWKSDVIAQPEWQNFNVKMPSPGGIWVATEYMGLLAYRVVPQNIDYLSIKRGALELETPKMQKVIAKMRSNFNVSRALRS